MANCVRCVMRSFCVSASSYYFGEHFNELIVMRSLFLSLAPLLLLIDCGTGANIFFYFGLSTYSHRITVWPLVEALADRGHNITFATTYHPKIVDPRVKEFYPAAFEKTIIEEEEGFQNYNIFKARREMGRFFGGQGFTVLLPMLAHQRCENFLLDTETPDFIKNSHFDLVVMDNLWNDCGLGLAAKWGAKTMMFGTSHPFEWTFEQNGVVHESNTISSLHISFQYPLSFLERTIGTVIHLAVYFYRYWVTLPKLEAMLKEKLEFPDMPSITELDKQVSLLLYNSHFSEEYARSLPPFYVPVGGMHCEPSKDPKVIPKELRKFIEESGEAGFMLVSFGGEAKLADAPENLKNIFLTAFAQSKIRIVLKWDGERPKDMPSNILTTSWYPQKEVLASRNIKAFMTHGGLLSMQEAVTHGVPMIAIPLFAEQDYNSFRLEQTGRGIRLTLETLTLEKLQAAISKILNDKSYKKNVERVSKLFKDRPAKPVETAVWWTEYVLRNDDTSHLKPLSVDQYWFQRRLLDVWAFLFVVVLTFSYLIFIILKKLLNCIFGRFSAAEPKRVKVKPKVGSGSNLNSKKNK